MYIIYIKPTPESSTSSRAEYIEREEQRRVCVGVCVGGCVTWGLCVHGYLETCLSPGTQVRVKIYMNTQTQVPQISPEERNGIGLGARGEIPWGRRPLGNVPMCCHFTYWVRCPCPSPGLA